MSKDNLKDISPDTLNKLLSSPGFSELNDDLKNKTLDSYFEQHESENEKSTGILGKLFGNKSENICLYIAFIICVSLILVGLIYILLPPKYKQNNDIEFWQIIGPIITGALGFIFGANSKK